MKRKLGKQTCVQAAFWKDGQIPPILSEHSNSSHFVEQTVFAEYKVSWHIFIILQGL